MSPATFVGILLVMVLIIGVSWFSGRKVSDAGDFFSGGGKAGPLLVCGTILGSLVSSQATIGTAQLAFQYGLSAWWFTLGSGIGCLILAIVYVDRLRTSGAITVFQVISREYGERVSRIGSALCSIGIFISILAQVVASGGLISLLLPSVSVFCAIVLSAIIMGIYVIFGGSWGAGMGGVVKLTLLYASAVSGLVCVLSVSGGPSALLDQLSAALAGTDLGLIQQAAGAGSLISQADVLSRYMSLTARGAAKDIGSGISLLLGVLSTQTYAQAIWSARSTPAARRGALLCAALTPPIGIAGIGIGIFMRTHYITQAEAAALTAAGMAIPDLPQLASTIQVFPAFVIHHMPPLFAGIVLGTLLITVVGGGAGLSLGMATILVKDILEKLSFFRIDTPVRELRTVRCTIGAVLAAAALAAILIPGSTINDLGFLSMGLRGAVVFLPLTCALWLPGRVNRKAVLVSTVLSPLTLLLGKLLPLGVDPLYPGMAVSLFCCLAGLRRKRFAGPGR